MMKISGYLLGFGSNIEPYDNIAGIINRLLEQFELLHLSRIVHIPPVGMNSQHYFLNAVALVETDITPEALKKICNQIEISLGRDRNDPERKFKDRPADIDILAPIHLPTDNAYVASSITDEYFLYPLIDELFAFLNAVPVSQQLQAGVLVNAHGLTFGESATTIYRN